MGVLASLHEERQLVHESAVLLAAVLAVYEVEPLDVRRKLNNTRKLRRRCRSFFVCYGIKLCGRIWLSVI